MDVIYLDNNATTQPAPEVVQAMQEALVHTWGNPSSIHRFGQRARQMMDEARGQIADLVNCGESELLFTGGGTEAINTAVRGLLQMRSPRKKIITTSVEHSATRELCQQLGREGNEIIEINVSNDGSLDLDQLRAAIAEDVALATIMWANNETGVIFPVHEIVEICHTQRIPVHIDATQAAGKVPVNVRDLNIDALTLAAHKFHGPKGVGSLFVRRGLRIKPLLIGGPQERGRRGGTENVPGIIGMGKAAELAKLHLPEMTNKVAPLRDHLEREILRTIPEATVNGRTDSRLPNTTNISFSRLEAEAILVLLSEQGICASAGSACSSGSLEPSHVLRAMNIDDKLAHGAIRFSLSRFTTQDEIDRTLAALPPIIQRLRSVLPVG